MVTEAKVKHFLSLARTLNFTVTAREFSLTQQAISKSIAGLENDLGVRLFARSKSSVELTEAGKKWRSYFSRESMRFNRQREQILNDEERGKQFRIGYQDYLIFYNIPNSVLKYMEEQYPNVELRAERHSPITLQNYLSEGKMDVIFLSKRFYRERKDQKCRVLINAPLLIVSSAMEPDADKRKTAADFSDMPYIMDIFDGESREHCMERGRREIKEAGLTCEDIVITPNRASCFALVEVGGGVLLGTTMSRAINNPLLKCTTTDFTDSLLYIWSENSNDRMAADFAKQIKEAYQADDLGADVQPLI